MIQHVSLVPIQPEVKYSISIIRLRQVSLLISCFSISMQYCTAEICVSYLSLTLVSHEVSSSIYDKLILQMLAKMTECIHSSKIRQQTPLLYTGQMRVRVERQGWKE